MKQNRIKINGMEEYEIKFRGIEIMEWNGIQWNENE